MSQTPPEPPVISPHFMRWFQRIVRRQLRKGFNALRLLGERPDIPPEEPLIVFMNHPSWWDPMLTLHLSAHLFPEREHFGPIDARALERYPILRKAGLFGVELDSMRGAKVFNDTAMAILKQPAAALWITPQGEFTSADRRPPEFKPGLGHLASRTASGKALPLAIDYSFWDEKRPEAFAAFGVPVDLDAPHSSPEWTTKLEASLVAAQDELAGAVSSREPEQFETLLGGRAGMGGIYGTWQKLRARIAGEEFDPHHAAVKG